MFTINHTASRILFRFITFSLFIYLMLASNSVISNWEQITLAALIWGGSFGRQGLISNPYFFDDIKNYWFSVCHLKEGGEYMKKQLSNQRGQGLVEYTLIVVLVALVFWVAIKNTRVGDRLAEGWSKIGVCVTSPLTCGDDDVPS